MSHLPERKEKDCLNCGAVVYGKYCHVCGQENKAPKETAWHLFTHFINDITHFDGKFFSSMKYLITRPGFLSREYSRGRRVNYLNPIRMYVFTSAIFFLIFYSFYSTSADEDIVISPWEESIKRRLDTLDNNQFRSLVKETVLYDSAFSKNSFLNRNKEYWERRQGIRIVDFGDEGEYRWLDNKIRGFEFRQDSLRSLSDSSFRLLLARKLMKDNSVSKENFTKHIGGIFFGPTYRSKEQYDSMQKIEGVKHDWLTRQFIYRLIEINKKYNYNDRAILKSLRDKFVHSIPQMLFVSLPLLALVLKLLYFRRKWLYYVDHGIFVLHIYIFIFLALLFNMGIASLEKWTGLAFKGTVQALVVISIFIYLYKAMRSFFQQSRLKTILKYFLLLFSAFILMIFLFAIFFFFSIYRI